MSGKLAEVSKVKQNEWEKQYQIEEDLRSLARAAAVKKDPERMKEVKVLAKKKLDESKRRKDEAETMINLGEGKDII